MVVRGRQLGLETLLGSTCGQASPGKCVECGAPLQGIASVRQCHRCSNLCCSVSCILMHGEFCWDEDDSRDNEIRTEYEHAMSCLLSVELSPYRADHFLVVHLETGRIGRTSWLTRSTRRWGRVREGRDLGLASPGLLPPPWDPWEWEAKGPHRSGCTCPFCSPAPDRFREEWEGGAKVPPPTGI